MIKNILSTRLVLVFLSALTIVVADALIKQLATNQSLWATLKNPWMLLVYGLYLIQIVFAIIIFVLKGELAVYTNLFIIFYSIFGVIFGVLFFKEQLSAVQSVGIILALAGAVLINK